MAEAELKLTSNLPNKTLQISRFNGATFTMPVLMQGDIMAMRICLVEPNPQQRPGNNEFNLIDVSNIAMKLAISAKPTGSGTEAPFVEQNDWNKNTDTNEWFADVHFNTTELNSWLGTNHERKDAYFEFEITEGANITTIFQDTVTIRAQVITGAVNELVTGETALSLEVAKQQFVQYLAEPGRAFILQSENKVHRRFLGVDNDGNAIDR